MKTRTAIRAASFALLLAAGAASAQVISYRPQTGDISIDTELGYMNDYGRRDRNYFIDDVVGNFGAPRYLVNDLLTTRRWDPGDVYYACALAYQLRRPCADVVRTREQNKGQGWGAIAKRMGIKPGSAEFHAMKGQVSKSNGKFKGHKSSSASAKQGDVLLHDGSSNKGDKGQSGDKGKSDKGKSDKGNADGKGKSDEKGKGNKH